MTTIKKLVLEPFKATHQNIYLRIVRILFRVALPLAILTVLGILQDQWFQLFKFPDLIVTALLVSVALIFLFNLISGMKFGIMSSLIRIAVEPYDDREKDVIAFYLSWVLYALGLIVLICAIYFMHTDDTYLLDLLRR